MRKQVSVCVCMSMYICMYVCPSVVLTSSDQQLQEKQSMFYVTNLKTKWIMHLILSLHRETI